MFREGIARAGREGVVGAVHGRGPAFDVAFARFTAVEDGFEKVQGATRDRGAAHVTHHLALRYFLEMVQGEPEIDGIERLRVRAQEEREVLLVEFADNVEHGGLF